MNSNKFKMWITIIIIVSFLFIFFNIIIFNASIIPCMSFTGNSLISKNYIYANIYYLLKILAAIATILGLSSLFVYAQQYIHSKISNKSLIDNMNVQIINRTSNLLKHFSNIMDRYVPIINKDVSTIYDYEMSHTGLYLSKKELQKRMPQDAKQRLYRNAEIFILNYINNPKDIPSDIKGLNIDIVKKGFKEIEYYCNKINEGLSYRTLDLQNILDELERMKFLDFLNKYESVFDSVGTSQRYSSCLYLLNIWHYYRD